MPSRSVRESGLTRLPLCKADGGLDAPVGLLHVKDMLVHGPGTRRWRRSRGRWSASPSRC